MAWHLGWHSTCQDLGLMLSMAMRSVVVHTYYVDVLTTSTMYLGTISAVALHGLVLSTTAS